MSSQKRVMLFVFLSMAAFLATKTIMDSLGLTPPPPPAAAPVNPAAAAVDKPAAPVEGGAKPPVAAAAADPAKVDPAKPAAPKGPKVPLVDEAQLVLGSTADQDKAGYRLEVRLNQVGAGVGQLSSADYDGETADGIPDRKTRLKLIRPDPIFSGIPPSFAITLTPSSRPGEAPVAGGEFTLDHDVWDVVRDKPDAPAVRAVKKSKGEGVEVDGQEVAFRTTVPALGVTVTKRFRLFKGEDGFEFDMTFESPEKEATVTYRLFGPHGIPIEGEGYTSNFRDVFFGQVKAGGSGYDVRTLTADDVAKAEADPERFSALPLKFAGVESQYFAVFLEPKPVPVTQEDRREQESRGFVARKDAASRPKSDVGVEVLSKPVSVGPNRTTTHAFRVYAGPKIADKLVDYGATDLASYRKNQWISIPFASSLAQNVIAPMLDAIYDVTRKVANLFGFKNGSYGVAIILLTMTVRLCLLPLGRKQAMISKKMAELQPHMVAIKEKYKDDKERQTRETFALYKQHGFNPAAGCLPALIQMPIFVGLWQALNNSVALRHSTFLYIQNLAAPDMLFSFGGSDLPLLGKYFNLLPFLVVALMLVQTKLFTPPPVTEEARQQQKMMKFIMVFMAFMFYKVPSGLGIYFITSSLWQVCERLILPKLTKSRPISPEGDIIVGGDGGGSSGPKGGGGSGPKPVKPQGWFAGKLEKLLEEANNERTIRNKDGAGAGNGNGSRGGNNGNGNGRDIPPDRNRNRPRPGKRR